MITDQVPNITSQRRVTLQEVNDEISLALRLTYGPLLGQMNLKTLNAIMDSFEFENRGGFWTATIWFRNESVMYRRLVQVLDSFEWY